MTNVDGPRFTGTHMLLIMLSFFGVIIVVNFYMAYSATHSFAGLVVENSYVASQHFNEKLAAVHHQAALGWKVDVDVQEDGVTVDARDAKGHPIRGKVDVEMTRPTTDRDDHDLSAVASGFGAVHLPTKLGSGAWFAAITITADDGNSYLVSHRVILADDAAAKP
jgi:nitrogen fixation protein FixH